MKIREIDIDTLARTIYGEARGEDGIGRQCVAWVIRNRAVQRYRGDTIAAVCRSPKQFSCWNDDDPNAALLPALTMGDRIFRYCMLSALLVADADQKTDPTKGARHYHTTQSPAWEKTWPPKWAQGKTPCAVVGRHQFYNDVA